MVQPVTGRPPDLSADAEAQPEQQLAPPPQIDRRRILRRLAFLALVVLVAVAVIGFVPGLASFRSRFTHANGWWLGLGGLLKILSGVAYVLAFHAVFCRRMRWRVSTEIGFSELGANAVLPVGGWGGLALGAWALRRGGMDANRIARRSVAFFVLTSVPNVAGVLVLSVGLALGLFAPSVNIALALVPAVLAAGAVVLVIAAGRWAAVAERRLQAQSKTRSAAVMRAVAGGIEEALMLLRERDPLLVVGLIGYLVCDVGVLWASFHAFGASPALVTILMGYLIGELGGLIPVPGGIGGIELGLVGALVLYGAPVGASAAAVLGYRAIALIIPSALGVIAFAMLRRTLMNDPDAISGCGSGEPVGLQSVAGDELPVS